LRWRDRPTLNVGEVARVTGLSPKAVSSLAEDGTLGSLRIADTTLVYTDDVVRVFAKPAQPEAAARKLRIVEEIEERLRGVP
jgi:hypothetical protein